MRRPVTLPRRRLAGLIGALVLLPGSLAACGASPEAGGLLSPAPTAPTVVVEGTWISPTAGAGSAAASKAFMTLSNPGPTDITLLRTHADAGTATLHEWVTNGGRRVMQAMPDGVTVPAGGYLHLAPGGFHVELTALRRPLASGDQVALTLEFSNGEVQTINAVVAPPATARQRGHSTARPTS